MKWLQTYKIHLVAVGFAIAFVLSHSMYVGRELEIEQLRNDNENLREHIVTLNERIGLLDSYPYEHSEIKTTNNDRSTDFPKHNDFGNCPKYRQCGCTCSNGEGATKKATKESTNLRDSRGVSF